MSSKDTSQCFIYIFFRKTITQTIAAIKRTGSRKKNNHDRSKTMRHHCAPLQQKDEFLESNQENQDAAEAARITTAHCCRVLLVL